MTETSEAAAPPEGGDEAGAAEETAGTPESPAPFAVRRGDRVQYGHRTGRIEVVRGGGPEPYEVRVAWDNQKYPEWLQYSTLRALHRKGEFRIL